MNRYSIIGTLGMVFLLVLFAPVPLLAIDLPHLNNCGDCHTFHSAPGPGLTSDASNSNLCMSCHQPGGDAATYPFNDGDQAAPGISGTSHRWDAAMPGTSSPNNPYGLRATADITNADLKARLDLFGDVVTCSVCHDQHSQTLTPWDPNASGTPGDAGRHFMRTDNEINQLCEDCHYYRTVASGQTDVRTWDGNKKSHPIVKNLTTDVTDSAQFVGAAPLETNFNAQTTPPRYHENGTGDTNLTNNLVLDSSSKLRCLSCHGIHYTDSDSTTVDGP